MSNVERPVGEFSHEPPSVDPATLEQPAIGLRVGQGQSDTIARTILRADHRGHHVFVLAENGTPQEVEEFSRRLGATVIDSDESGHIGSPTHAFRNAARTMGFPGVVIQDNLDLEIDFEASAANLLEAESYCIEAVLTAETSDRPRILVGIPAHNEEITIGTVVVSALETADEVIVVDDGSTDRTATVASQAGAIVVSHEENRGKGAAIRSLLRRVRDEPFDAVVVLDGDGQHYPQEIPTVVEPVVNGEADLVVGSRYMDGSKTDETPRYRRFGQRVLDLLTIGTARHQLSDSQSGFRALSPQAVEGLHLRSNGFQVESEMIDRARRDGLEITERPIDVRYDGVKGSNENPLKHGLSVVNFILQLVRDRHPLVFFGIPGVVVMTFGILYGIEAILIYQSTGAFYPAKALVSGFVTIIGVLGMFLGLVLNSITNRVAEIRNDTGGDQL